MNILKESTFSQESCGLEIPKLKFDTQQSNENIIFAENYEMFKNISIFYKRCVFAQNAHYNAQSDDCAIMNDDNKKLSDKFTD